jgi:predicted enzyme related to lactoylglutathione lyase
MKINRQIVVFHAADLTAESTFWAGLLGGTVDAEDDWHSVVVDGEWRLGIQLAPDHVPSLWPGGTPQQIHLDLYVDDIKAAHDKAVSLGARQLKPARDVPRCGGALSAAFIGTKETVRYGVAPRAVTPSDAAVHALPGKPGLFEGALLGGVIHIRDRLDAMRCCVREQIARQQPVRVRTVSVATDLRQHRDPHCPVVRHSSH